MNPPPSAYPLQWPAGWPRTDALKREPGKFRCTVAGALEELRRQLTLMGAKSVVLSSNYTLGTSNLVDPGVCVYFQREGLDLAIPCDRWRRIEANIKAIALTVEALRGMDRWGAKHMIRAMFSGFKLLPAGASRSPEWWKVLGCDPHTPTERVLELHRQLMKRIHPDVGGSHIEALNANEALATFKAERGL